MSGLVSLGCFTAPCGGTDVAFARRANPGLDSILTYSAVCAGGMDTVPLPGDTSEDAIARIVGDVATLAFKWNKPLAARLLPAPERKPVR